MTDLSKEEELVGQYVKEDNKEAAVKLLFGLIVKHARGKNFSKAKALREWLYKVDPMALTEIVRSGEIIEREESEAIDKKHLDIWIDLYKKLAKEEASAFYYALREAAYDAGQPVFKQGELNSRLYFINEGQLKLVWSQKGKEVLLRTLERGDIAGEDTFFSNSVCTTSMISVLPARLNYLERAILTKWKNEFPGLETRLNDYCSKIKKVSDIIKKMDINRRSEKRKEIAIRGTIRILNASGSPISKEFKGKLSDISTGGLSFVIKISKKETASMLLGKKLSIKFMPGNGEPQQKIEVSGLIIGVQSHPFDDYSVHVKFDKKLSKEMMTNI